jgi:hypothetical protein
MSVLCQKQTRYVAAIAIYTQCNYYKVEKWTEDVAKVDRVPGKAGHHRRR